MKTFLSRRTQTILLAAFFSAALLGSLSAGCGNDDYAKPIKQFQDASAVVIASARQSLHQMNDVEEKAEVNREIFEAEAIDEKKIKGRDVITQEEIDIRVKALDQLARYTAALGDLASLKTPGQVTQQFQDVGSAFSALAQDASKLSPSSGAGFNNAKFSGIMQAATAAIGVVVRAVEEHKARRELEKQIRDNDHAITELIGLIGDELEIAYLRRKQADSAEKVFLTNALKLELERPGHGDPALRWLLGERLNAWRDRQSALANANPKPSVEAMRKAHEALVAYMSSDKSPKSLSELYAAAQDFFSRVQPLAQAMAALVKTA